MMACDSNREDGHPVKTAKSQGGSLLTLKELLFRRPHEIPMFRALQVRQTLLTLGTDCRHQQIHSISLLVRYLHRRSLAPHWQLQ